MCQIHNFHTVTVTNVSITKFVVMKTLLIFFVIEITLVITLKASCIMIEDYISLSVLLYLAIYGFAKC